MVWPSREPQREVTESTHTGQRIADVETLMATCILCEGLVRPCHLGLGKERGRRPRSEREVCTRSADSGGHMSPGEGLGPMKQRDERTGLKDWLAMVERLRYAPQWAAEGPVPVEVTQTHISVVLLGRARLLKLKKPVSFGFLDYTTLEQRRLACEAE